jgi:hypothetical protein
MGLFWTTGISCSDVLEVVRRHFVFIANDESLLIKRENQIPTSLLKDAVAQDSQVST